jgi:hypothetical protein
MYAVAALVNHAVHALPAIDDNADRHERGEAAEGQKRSASAGLIDDNYSCR